MTDQQDYLQLQGVRGRTQVEEGGSVLATPTAAAESPTIFV